MSALAWWFVLVMAAALYVDLGIARDSWKRGWMALAAFSSLAALCAVVGIAFSMTAIINGGAS